MLEPLEAQIEFCKQQEKYKMLLDQAKDQIYEDLVSLLIIVHKK